MSHDAVKGVGLDDTPRDYRVIRATLAYSFAHHCDLASELHEAGLIDAEGVYPECTCQNAVSQAR